MQWKIEELGNIELYENVRCVSTSLWISFIRLDSFFRITWVDVVSRFSHVLFIIIEKDKKAISCVIEKIEATEKSLVVSQSIIQCQGFVSDHFEMYKVTTKERLHVCEHTEFIYSSNHTHTHTYTRTHTNIQINKTQ